jgi:hypothetical protein
MISIALTSAFVYLVIGLIAAVITYVRVDGDREEDDIIFDAFLWPLLILGGVLVLVSKATKWIGDWILARRSGAE